MILFGIPVERYFSGYDLDAGKNMGVKWRFSNVGLAEIARKKSSLKLELTVERTLAIQANDVAFESGSDQMISSQ